MSLVNRRLPMRIVRQASPASSSAPNIARPSNGCRVYSGGDLARIQNRRMSSQWGAVASKPFDSSTTHCVEGRGASQAIKAPQSQDEGVSLNHHNEPNPTPMRVRPQTNRGNILSFAVSDSAAEALEVMRKSYPIAPPRSTFLAHIMRDWIERHRRKDVPCVARHWKVE